MVPVAGMLSGLLDVGKEAMGGWGVCNHSQPIIVMSAMFRCLLEVTAGQGTQLVHSTALQEITRLSRRAEKAGEFLAICPSLRKCLIL